MSVVGSSSSVQLPPSLGRLAAIASARPVVGDRRREQGDVDVGERQRGVEHQLRGGGRDRLDPGGRRHGEIGGQQDDLGAPAPRLVRERDAHPAGGAVAEEADGVDRLAGAAGGDEHALAGEAARREQLRRPGAAISPGSAIRPTPHSPSAVSPSSGPTSSMPRARERLGVRARRRVRPHARVHRGREEHRAAVGQRGLDEDVVGEPVGELRERVRRARSDDEQVGPGQVRIRVVAGRPAGERGEGLRADEALRAGRDERDHLVPALDEQAGQLTRLVGGDAAADTEQDAAHARSLPATAGRGCCATEP